MIRYEEIEPYLLDYLQGKAEEATEYRIKAYLQQNPNFEQELNELQETLAFVEQSPLLEPEPALKMNFYAMLNDYQIQMANPKPLSLWAKISQFWTENFGKTAPAWAGVFVLLIFSSYFLFNYFNYPPLAESTGLSLQKEAEKKPTETPQLEPLAVKPEQTEAKIAQVKPQLEPKKELAITSELPLSEKPHANLALVSDEVVINQPLLRDAPQPVTSTRAGIPKPLNLSRLDIASNMGISYDDLNIQKTDTDARLQTIAGLLSRQMPEVAVNQLLDMLNNDPSPHVRMWAMEALEYYADQEDVRQKVMQSLDKQASPHLQLATIDWIVKYDLKDGSQPLKELLNQTSLNPLVREQAEIALENR
jgi:hypothetical protein